jgi:hypothetical protein
MKAIRLLVLPAALAAAVAAAGEIRGTLTNGGKPVVGATVEIKVGNRQYTPTTDKFGSYRVLVAERGNCTVVVVVERQRSSPVTVNSVDRSVQYDLSVQKVNGQYVLKTR